MDNITKFARQSSWRKPGNRESTSNYKAMMTAVTKRPNENNLLWAIAGLEVALDGGVVARGVLPFEGPGGGLVLVPGFGMYALLNLFLSSALAHPPSGSTLVAPPVGPPPIPTPPVIFPLTLKLSNLLTLKFGSHFRVLTSKMLTIPLGSQAP